VEKNEKNHNDQLDFIKHFLMEWIGLSLAQTPSWSFRDFFCSPAIIAATPPDYPLQRILPSA
jgi:hypothetical protein